MEVMAPIAEEARVMFLISNDNKHLYTRVYTTFGSRVLKEVKKVKSMILYNNSTSDTRYEQGFRLKMYDGSIRFVLTSDYKDNEAILRWISRHK